MQSCSNERSLLGALLQWQYKGSNPSFFKELKGRYLITKQNTKKKHYDKDGTRDRRWIVSGTGGIRMSSWITVG